jgi:hypothetical protein
LDAARYILVAALPLFSLIAAGHAQEPPAVAENSLAVINSGVSQAEDAPFAGSSYRFLPGDYVYVTWEIAGFGIESEQRGEVRRISLQYEITPQDSSGRALAEPVSDSIRVELSPEDKNWVPKRRANFLLPSYVGAGTYHVHIAVKDLIHKTEAAHDIPFRIGGVQVKPSDSIAIQDFAFYRDENSNEGLSVPAFSAGDTVYARFNLTGYHLAAGNQYRLAYSVSVNAPDGKPYLNDPGTANLQSASFYPAQFVPGNIAVATRKDAIHGEYVVTITARDLVSNQSVTQKQAFSIE